MFHIIQNFTKNEITAAQLAAKPISQVSMRKPISRNKLNKYW